MFEHLARLSRGVSPLSPVGMFDLRRGLERFALRALRLRGRRRGLGAVNAERASVMSDRAEKYKLRLSTRSTVPEARTLSQAEAERILRRQVFIDATKAGLLKPCCMKKNTERDKAIFATSDVRAVEDLILAGVYPGQEAAR